MARRIASRIAMVSMRRRLGSPWPACPPCSLRCWAISRLALPSGMLVYNAAVELTASYYFTILRANLIGLNGEVIKEIA